MSRWLSSLVVCAALTCPLASAVAQSSSAAKNDAAALYAAPPAGFDIRRENIAHGKLETVEYDSKTVGTKRKAKIYLPPGYSGDTKYPVLYLLHGIGGDENEWSRGGAPDTILDNLYAEAQAAPMIVVMPNGRAAMDLTARDPIPKQSPAFAAFEKDLLSDLIPFIEKTYSTRADRQSRALAGLSMGGGQALNFGLGNVDSFAWIGGFSSAPNTRPPVELIKDHAETAKELRLLYLACGDEDRLLRITQDVHSMLDEHRVPHIYRVIPGGRHDFKVWKSDLYHFARLIFRDNSETSKAQDAGAAAAQPEKPTPQKPAAEPNPAPAQPAAAPDGSVAEDFQPARSNQPGRQFPQVNSQRRARFRIVAPQAQSVRVPEWGGITLTEDAEGAWVGTTRPLDEGFHYYRINIDGADVPDPGSKFFYGANRWGSAIEIPAHDEDFYALKNVPHGHLRENLYFSKSTNATRRCFVYTPPDYDTRPDTRYPVLYLQHGAGEDETGWANQGRTNLIMDNLIAAGKTQPFIIVMDNGGNIGGGPRRGGAPPAGAAAGPGPDSKGAQKGAGGSSGRPAFNFSAFAQILTDELIPFIDAHYRTLSDQAHRGMAGLSMGGFQTRQITLANLDKFSHIGVFSGGSIAPDDAALAAPAAFKQKVKVLFVSYGSKENTAAAKANHEALEKLGIENTFYVSPDTAHEWQSWRRSLHEFAPLLFRGN